MILQRRLAAKDVALRIDGGCAASRGRSRTERGASVRVHSGPERDVAVSCIALVAFLLPSVAHRRGRGDQLRPAGARTAPAVSSQPAGADLLARAAGRSAAGRSGWSHRPPRRPCARAARSAGRTGSSPACAAALEARGVARAVARTRSRPPSSRGTAGTSSSRPDRVGQVAGLPAARADRGARGDRGAERRGSTVLYLAPTKALAPTSWRAVAAARACRRCAPRPTTATPRTRSATGSAQHASSCSTNPDMLHRSMLPGTSAGPRSCARWRTSSSTSATPTAASSARTSPRCCAGCGGSARGTAPTPVFVLASATVGRARRRRASRLTGVDVAAVTDDALAARRDVVRAVGAAAHRATRRERRARCAARPPPRPPTCWPTWSSRACGPWRSSGRGAAPRRSR